MPISYIQHRILSQLLYRSTENKYINNYWNYCRILLVNDIHPNPGPNKTLNIGYTNIRSLFSDTDNTLLIDVQDCKFNDMNTEFNYINNCDLIFLTETWLQDNEMNKYQLHIKNYRNPIFKNRPGKGGGLLIYYKENLQVEIIQTLQNYNLEHMVVEVKYSTNAKFIFNLIYRPPTSDTNITDNLINNFYDCYNYSIQNNYNGIYFLGDFNYPNINWVQSSQNNHIFYDAITQLGLFQLIYEPIRYKNILDLLITDSPGYTNEITINPPIKNCDHNVILFNINFQDKLINTLPRKIYKYQEANWDIINNNLKKEPWIQKLYEMDNIDDMVEYLQNVIYKEMNNHIPSFILSNKKRKNLFINYKIRKYIILQKRHKKIYNENPTPYNKNKYLNTKDILDKMFLNARNNYYDNISKNLKQKNYNSRKFWNICNTLLKRKLKANIGDIIYNRKIYKNDKDKVRIIGDYFAEQVTNDNNYYDNSINYSNNSLKNTQYKFPEITKNMIEQILITIKIHTANGPDNISNIFLKRIKDFLSIPLTYILNYSLLHGVYPKQWKISNWTPLHKNDSPYKRENYRPISLCNNLGKILDKIIFKSFYNYLDHNQLLNEYNYGFKRKSSCQHNLSMLLHNTYENLDKNCDTLILFLDVVKAFDKVDHKILLQKINLMGIDITVFTWFKNYLQDRYSKCVIHGYESELYHIQTSVTQGSVLATLLWSIFAYDITENIISNPYIFADDTALVEKIQRDDVDNAFNIIQFDIDQLLHWAKENKIEFSKMKTKYIIISNSHLQKYPHLYMDDIILERVQNYKQLGLYIDENLNWENHINYTIQKTPKIIHMLK